MMKYLIMSGSEMMDHDFLTSAMPRFVFSGGRGFVFCLCFFDLGCWPRFDFSEWEDLCFVHAFLTSAMPKFDLINRKTSLYFHVFLTSADPKFLFIKRIQL